MKNSALRKVSALLALALTIIVLCGFNFPKQHGFVTDDAKIIDNDAHQSLERELQNLKDSTGWEIGVVTVSSLEDATIFDYTTALFEKWGIGQKKIDNGILFLIAPNEHKCRIATGGGAGGVIPDIVTGRIIRELVSPKTKAGDWTGGITAGTRELIRLIQKEAAQPGYIKTTVKKNTQANSDEQQMRYLLIFCLIVICIIVWLIIRKDKNHPYYTNSGSYRSSRGGYYGGSSYNSGGFFGGGGGGGGGDTFSGGTTDGGGGEGDC